MATNTISTLKALLMGLLLLGSVAVRAQTTPLSDLDALRYIASYPDLIQAYGADPEKGRSHYENFGIREGRKITFEPLPYIASYPDLIEAFGTDTTRGTRHYIQSGYREGRQTTFNALRYTASYPDLMAAFGIDETRAATHYIQVGYREKRQTTFTESDALRYIASYSDLIRAFGADVTAGVKHYIAWGFNEGRRIVFDALAYIASYADLIAAFGADTAAGARHYIQWGLQEGRSLLFDAASYLSLNADVRSAFQGNTQSATRHFITNGIGEARPISNSLQISRSSITFDTTSVGQTSRSETITLVNNSSAPITFTSIRIDGKDSDQFRQSTDCVRAAGLAPRASCSVILEFRPSKFGARSAVLYLLRSSAVAVVDPKILLLGTGTGSLGTPSGDSRQGAAKNAVDLLAARPGIESGLYWFDPDGTGGNDPFLTYADMAIAGGGWTQVRRIAGVGGWYPFDDNLRGLSANNPTFSSEINAPTHWSLKFDYFVDSNTEYLFASGDGEVWCVLRRGALDFDSAMTVGTRSTPVLYSSGTLITEGGKTNVLLRSAPMEDPWIGCEGDHVSNTQQMLYGEAGIGDYRTLKNSRSGINVFVRPAQFHPRLRQVVVDVDAKKNATSDQSGTTFVPGNYAIQVYLPAGEYEFVPIGPVSAAGTGAFTAIELCTCDVNPRKFVHLYDYTTSENATRTRVQRANNFDWNEAGRALNDALPTKITLRQSGWVKFFVYDTNFSDNAGGVSVLIRDARFAVLSASPTSVSLAAVGASARVTIQNTGGEALSISSISFTGTNASLFAQSNDCLRSIGPGLSCPIDVRWVSTQGSALTASATLRIESNNKSGVTLIPVSGEIIVPPTADLDFGNQAVNTTSAQKSVILTGPMLIGFIRAEEVTASFGTAGDGGLSTEFQVASHNCPVCEGPTSSCSLNGPKLPDGASCTVNVNFRPTSAGKKLGNLTLRSPRGLSPGVGAVYKSYSLSGTGVTAGAPPPSGTTPTAIPSRTTLHFATGVTQPVNSASSAQTFTISNSGNSALAISRIYLSGTDSSSFNQTNNCVSVPPGERCAVTVLFRPLTSGPKDAAITISHNAGSDITVALTGNKGFCVATDFSSRTVAEGLGGGRVTSIHSSSGRIYVGTNPGGLAVSDDGGKTFSNKTTSNGLGSNNVSSVFTTGEVVLVGTESGLSVSSNGGQSFVNRTSRDGLADDVIYSVSVAGNALYVGTLKGLSISRDGGVTFENKTTSNGIPADRVLDIYAEGNMVYVATDKGLAISRDGGRQFTSATTLDGNPVRSIVGANGRLFAGTETGFIISLDGGVTFQSKDRLGGFTAAPLYELAYVDGVLFGGSSSGLHISFDEGESFITRTEGLVRAVYRVGNSVLVGGGGSELRVGTLVSDCLPTSMATHANRY